jgi:hypothetical protein
MKDKIVTRMVLDDMNYTVDDLPGSTIAITYFNLCKGPPLPPFITPLSRTTSFVLDENKLITPTLSKWV